MRSALLALVSVLLLPSAARAFQVERISGPRTSARAGTSIEVVAEEAMVKFSTTPASDHSAVLSRIGASVVQEFPDIGWTEVALASGTSVPSGLAQLRGLSEILSAQPNHVYRTGAVPSDPLVASQSNLSQINAFGGWDFETGFTNKVTIAVIDSGVDGTHPDLASKILNVAGAQSLDCTVNPCVVDNGGTPTANCSHGTQTAGVAAAAANNGVGIAGISWGAKIVSIKIFSGGGCTATSDCNACNAGATDAGVIRGINAAKNLAGVAAAGRVVMNMSFGSAGAACVSDPDGTAGAANAIQAALQAAAAVNGGQGIPMAVAAGNGGGAVDQPANCAPTVNGLIPAGSVDANNNISYFSSRGSEMACCGVVAPGENIETSNVGGGYASVSGTSFSAPTVAGLAALILSAKPTLTSAQVQAYIRGGADGIGVSSLGGAAPSSIQTSGSSAGAGRIDMFRTMRLATRGTLADFVGDQKAIAIPNPFRPGTQGQVTITVPTSLQGSHTSVKIFTVDAHLVKDLGAKTTWDGKNDTGSPVVSGTYVFEVKTDAGMTTGRLAVIR